MAITRTTAPRTRFGGIWLPLITPFRNGALDEASLRKLLRHYVGLPIDGRSVTTELLRQEPGTHATRRAGTGRVGDE